MLAELRVTPVGSHPSFAELIADLVPLLAESPLHYQVHAMGTTLEGDLGAILRLVEGAHRELRRRSPRILIELSIDDRDAAEGELVRSLHHLRDLAFSTPLERFVSPAEHALERHEAAASGGLHRVQDRSE
jgi:uncharacterized protein (TIGR00106 family)